MKPVYFSTLKGEFIEKVISLACSAYVAIQNGKSVLVIDNPLFDIEYLTKMLKKYNLTVLEKDDLDFTRVAVFYGKGKQILDLTDQAPPLLNIETNLNSLQGDPYPNQLKELFFCYRIKGIEYTETYPENRSFPIVMDPSRATYVHDFFWLNKANLVVYNDILKHIRVKQISDIKTKYHVIHLLSNEDMKQCAIQVKKEPDHFIKVISAKYIEIIQQFVKNTTDTLVILQSEDNPEFMDFLKNKGNPYVLMNTNQPESFAHIHSEIGVFLGVFNMEKLTGSACSYYLHTTLSCKQSILIDIDHL